LPAHTAGTPAVTCLLPELLSVCIALQKMLFNPPVSTPHLQRTVPGNHQSGAPSPGTMFDVRPAIRDHSDARISTMQSRKRSIVEQRDAATRQPRNSWTWGKEGESRPWLGITLAQTKPVFPAFQKLNYCILREPAWSTYEFAGWLASEPIEVVLRCVPLPIDVRRCTCDSK